MPCWPPSFALGSGLPARSGATSTRLNEQAPRSPATTVEEFRRLAGRGSWNSFWPAQPPNHAKAFSKQLRTGSEPIVPSGPSPARWSGFNSGGQSHRQPRCRRQLPSNARKITHKKSQAPMEGRPLAHVRYRLGYSLAGTPNAGWRPGRRLCRFSGAALIAGN